MQITLYKNFNKRINSTKRPSGGTTVDVVFKDNTNVESPTFLIDGVDLDVNYCHAFGHYYYINDITVGNRNIYELHCTQDVLATYKNDIAGLSAFVERSASAKDEFLIDGLATASGNVTYESQSIPLFTQSLTDGTYVVGVVGGGNAGTAVGAVDYFQ